MKRAILRLVAAAAAGWAAACSPDAPRPAPAEAEATRDWARPPTIEQVRPVGAALAVSGLADPGARVVLRGDGGAAFATAADSQGRFEVRMPAPGGHLLLRPEVQVGQDAASSPEQLLVLGAGRGPIAVLRTGGPTRRLDAAPALGAIDSDGRMRLASGRVAAGTATVEVQSRGETLRVAPDAAGRWSVILGPQDGAESVQIGGRTFVWPGEAAATDNLEVERLEDGWRIRWAGPGGARQTTWLPDA